MEFLLLKVLIGFIVGTLIGLTGLGGGVLLLPMLIFGLRIPAIVAVGSDAMFNFFTKIPASIMHVRKGTVRRRVVLAMAVGSIPGSYLGVAFLQHLRHVYGNGVNDFIKSAVGMLLVLIQRGFGRGGEGRGSHLHALCMRSTSGYTASTRLLQG